MALRQTLDSPPSVRQAWRSAVPATVSDPTPVPERGGRKAYEVVLRHIEDEIIAGRLQVGSLLPPERELAASLRVSRSAAREAIRALEAQGVLSSGVGVGPGGGTRVTDQRSRALARLLRLQVALARFPIDEVVELRVALERSAVALAAQRATPAALAEVDRLLGQMGDPGIELPDFNGLDNDFHVQLARLGGMTLITDLTAAVRESVRQPILDSSARMSDWAAFRADLQYQHQEIRDAIAAGLADRAADLVEQHIRYAYAVLLG
ncbi:GntR family transcriptional regulator [Enemella evansiae]|uniref:GntR family transcriptional regulator n=1 Tax=Enemella evansiae TaxID=2016499 RepID=A0A255G0M7_9ACTN|nr:GntR family transcriptional regulator [Enemella evansiae]OYN93823.1 GntR family transcriptional regulator [Enemella evansiae]OYO05898.1 GntR family transcriptional regulator [Enemella evansiae]OYO07926.1 GntR family transcriptional regulator [Enemella evansiae]